MYKKRHTAEAYNSILGIPQTSTVTILGLTFQPNCKFSTHLKEKLCKANKCFYYMANPVIGKSLFSDWFFLAQDFAARTVSMETVQPVYFCFGAKPANSKFATKTAKKKCEYCHSSQLNYQKS